MQNCKECQVDKELALFRADKRIKTGNSKSCKDCLNKTGGDKRALKKKEIAFQYVQS